MDCLDERSVKPTERQAQESVNPSTCIEQLRANGGNTDTIDKMAFLWVGKPCYRKMDMREDMLQ